MTREEAIAKLKEKRQIFIDEWADLDDIVEAFDMAISALSAEPSDLISRAELIKAIPQTSVDMFENCRNCELLDREQVIDIINEVPSVSVESKATENKYDCDLISRAEAIEAVCNAMCEEDAPYYPECDQKQYCLEIQALKALPSAEPKIIKVRKDGTLFVKVLDVSKVHKVEVYDNGDLSKQFGCSADSPTDWTPLRFEDEYKMTSDFPWELDGSWVIVTDGQRVSVERIKKDAYDHFFPNGRYFELEDTIAWMPLPKIINNITESPNDVDETDDEVIEPSDIISRADAKKEVYLLGKNPSINEIWDCLDALPSADRPSGEWIKDYEKNIYKCSVCGCEEVVPTCMGEPTIWKYCPNCGSVIGARMKGGAE